MYLNNSFLLLLYCKTPATMVKISRTRTCIYCNQYKINKHMCWNRHCSDFGVIRLLVEVPEEELSCDECGKWVDPISMLCINETCHSYGDREDDYYEEDDLIEKLIKKFANLNEDNNEKMIIKRKCKKFISENFPITRCHSTLENHYLEALISKVLYETETTRK